MATTHWIGAIAIVATLALADAQLSARVDYFDVPAGSHPHDAAAVPTAGGPVYFTEQASGKLGVLDPSTGKSIEIPLGEGSTPHGVVVAVDGAAWVTDGGQTEISRGCRQSCDHALPVAGIGS